jgi:hypothetical protein
MWRIIVLAAALAACGDNIKPTTPDDAAPPQIDAAIDGGPNAVGPCLDRPGEPTKAPAGQLPCELISPAFHP